MPSYRFEYQVGDIIAIDRGIGIVLPGESVTSEDHVYSARIRAPEEIIVYTVSHKKHGILVRTTDYSRAQNVFEENLESIGTLSMYSHYYKGSKVREYIRKFNVPFNYTPGERGAPAIIRRNFSSYPKPKEEDLALPRDILEKYGLAGDDTGKAIEYIPTGSDNSFNPRWDRELYPRNLNNEDVHKVEVFPRQADVFFIGQERKSYKIKHPQRLIEYCQRNGINVVDVTMLPKEL
jgi:hypothetical protein